MYLIQSETSQTYHFQVTEQNMGKMSKKGHSGGLIYGPHTHVKCLFKALIFGTYTITY